jgi:integrase
MGTITPRTNKDGTLSYKVELRIRRKGQIVHQETQTFERQQAARAWMKKRETELAVPGALDTVKAGDPPLSEAITRYLDGAKIPITGDKLAKLKAIRDGELGKLACSKVDSEVLIAFGRGLNRAPSTVNGYLSYLTTVFEYAPPEFGYPLKLEAMLAARKTLGHHGVAGASNKRERRPTLDELQRIMDYLRRRHLGYKGSMPMDAIVPFAIFSTRRLGEIVRMKWADIDEARCKLRVYNMKHPKKKIGNHVWVDLTPEALQILRAVPRTGELVFPYLVSSVSDAFKEACGECSVVDLTFHDLRHEGVSRLIELEYSIPQVALMSGHVSWANLQRYANDLEFVNKFAGWPWLDIVAPLPQRPLGWQPR